VQFKSKIKFPLATQMPVTVKLLEQNNPNHPPLVIFIPDKLHNCVQLKHQSQNPEQRLLENGRTFTLWWLQLSILLN